MEHLNDIALDSLKTIPNVEQTFPFADFSELQLIYKFIFQQLDSLFGPQSSLKEFWRLSTRPLLVPSSLVTWRFIENLNIRSPT